MALRSDDPYDAPKLDIGYLTDSEGADMATLRCAFFFSKAGSQKHVACSKGLLRANRNSCWYFDWSLLCTARAVCCSGCKA